MIEIKVKYFFKKLNTCSASSIFILNSVSVSADCHSKGFEMLLSLKVRNTMGKCDSIDINSCDKLVTTVRQNTS